MAFRIWDYRQMYIPFLSVRLSVNKIEVYAAQPPCYPADVFMVFGYRYKIAFKHGTHPGPGRQGRGAGAFCGVTVAAREGTAAG